MIYWILWAVLMALYDPLAPLPPLPPLAPLPPLPPLAPLPPLPPLAPLPPRFSEYLASLGSSGLYQLPLVLWTSQTPLCANGL